MFQFLNSSTFNNDAVKISIKIYGVMSQKLTTLDSLTNMSRESVGQSVNMPEPYVSSSAPSHPY
jgi:hypothetical protein